MYTFDLRKALNGHELVMRCGREAINFMVDEDGDDDYPFCFTDQRHGDNMTCASKGRRYWNMTMTSPYDLFMKYEKDK